MLTLKEAGLSLRAINIFSILNTLPIKVDVKSGKIQMQTNKVKVFISKILFGIVIMHWLYMFGRLLQSTVIVPEKFFKWDHLILHFGCTTAGAVFHFTGVCLFVLNAEENVIIFNQLFAQSEDPVQKVMDRLLQIQTKRGSGNGKQGNKTGGKSGTQPVSTPTSAREANSNEGQPGQHQNQKKDNEYKTNSEIGPRPLLTWPPQYALDELLAKLINLAAVFTAFCAVLILAIDPSRPQLLFSSLPPEYQNVWSFLPLLAVEGLCMAILCLTASFAIGTQVLFFGKCHLELKRMRLQLRNCRDTLQNCSLSEELSRIGIEIQGRDIEREIWILRQILKEMNELVVLIELFNRCFPFCIFAWKIFSLSLFILSYFFAIRHVEEFKILGFFLAYCAVALTVIYTIMYSNAFSIPGKIDELKKEFLLTAQKITTTISNANSSINKNVKAEIKRIRGVGVKVWSFHQMERESTPNFVNFVIDQVVTLLVTFPR